VSVGDLAGLVNEAMGSQAKIRYLPARNEVLHAFADHSKVRRVFNVGDEVSLREGLSKMSGWAKQAGARKSSAFGGVEITRGLPSVWLEEDLV
jgi:UDP-glucose 4-epimerase